MYKQLLSDPYEHIAAIIPCYTATGDMTTIVSTTGEPKITAIRVRTVLNRLARSRAMDLIALKQKVTDATEHRILQPLPLAPGLVLCPIKVRIPRMSGDSSIGYINFHAITDVTASSTPPYQSTITLIGGTKLPALWKPCTVKKHLQHAKLALSHTADQFPIRPEFMVLAQKILKFIFDVTDHDYSAPIRSELQP